MALAVPARHGMELAPGEPSSFQDNDNDKTRHNAVQDQTRHDNHKTATKQDKLLPSLWSCFCLVFAFICSFSCLVLVFVVIFLCAFICPFILSSYLYLGLGLDLGLVLVLVLVLFYFVLFCLVYFVAVGFLCVNRQTHSDVMSVTVTTQVGYSRIFT
jgi:hypothetical protein